MFSTRMVEGGCASVVCRPSISAPLNGQKGLSYTNEAQRTAQQTDGTATTEKDSASDRNWLFPEGKKTKPGIGGGHGKLILAARTETVAAGRRKTATLPPQSKEKKKKKGPPKKKRNN